MAELPLYGKLGLKVTIDDDVYEPLKDHKWLLVPQRTRAIRPGRKSATWERPRVFRIDRRTGRRTSLMEDVLGDKFVRTGSGYKFVNGNPFDFRRENLILKNCPHGDLRPGFFNTYRKQAGYRKIPFEITIAQAWEVFVAQGRRCAYTGLELTLTPFRNQADGTASLDRIDSKKGYTLDNIQWVHKVVNVMKMALPDDEFIQWCCLVARHRGKLITPSDN